MAARVFLESAFARAFPPLRAAEPPQGDGMRVLVGVRVGPLLIARRLSRQLPDFQNGARRSRTCDPLIKSGIRAEDEERD